MGEIAEGIINGELCQDCQLPLSGEAPGFPRLCEDCEGEIE